MSNFDVLVRVGADISNLTNGFARANQATSSMGKNLSATGSKLTKMGMAMAGVGTVGLGMAAGIGASVKAAATFETAWAGVEKTVDGNAKQMKALQKELLTITKNMPQSTKEIFGVAEAAGQLGIKRDNIAKFTKTMLDLGVATNMTSEEAATDLARLANITQMPQKDFDRLGATIVDLGNHFATTEKEITEMGLRLAGQGKQVGMSEAQILGLATAMSSVGINAEAGGTAMTTVMKKINNAVDSGGSKLNGFAKLAGMSAGEFKKAWKSDAASALDAVVHGLSKSSSEGKNLTAILSDLGIKGIRESDTLLRLSGNADLLTSALSTANKAWKNNTALLNEANKRYATFDSQIGITKKVMTEFLRALGTPMKDVIGKLLQSINSVVIEITEFINKFNESHPKLAKFGAAVTLVVTAIFLLIGAIGAVVTQVGLFAIAAGELMEFDSVKKVILGVRTALTGLIGPVGIVIGVIAALAVGFIALYKNCETFRNGVNKAFSAVTNTVKKVGSTFKTVFGAIKNMFKGNVYDGAEKLKDILPPVVVEGVIRSVGAIKDALHSMSEPWGIIKKSFTDGSNVVKNVVMGIVKLFQGNWADGATLLHNILPDTAIVALINSITIIREALAGFKKMLGDFFNYLKTSSNISDIFSGMFDIIVASFVGLTSIVGSLLTSFLYLITGNWSKSWEALGKIPGQYMNALNGVFEALKTSFGGVIGVIKDFGGVLGEAFTKLDTMTGGSISAAVNWLIQLKNWFIGVAEAVQSKFGSAISFISGLLTKLGGAFGAIGGVLTLAASLFVKIGLSMIGLTGPFGLIIGLLASFGMSWVKTGDLSSQGLVTVFNNLGETLTNALNYLTENLPRMMSIGTQLIVNLINGITESLPGIMTSAVNIITTVVNAIVNALPKILSIGIQLITMLINGIVQALPAILGAGIQIITGIVNAIVQALPVIISVGIQIITSLLQALISAIPVLLPAAVQIIIALVTALIGALPMIIAAGIQLLMALIQGILQILPQLIQAAITLIMALVQGLIQNLPLIIQAGIQLLMALIQGLLQILPQLIQAAITLLMALVQGLIENIPLLIQAAIQLVMGLIGGLLENIPLLIQAAIDLIVGLVQGLIENIPLLIQAGIQLVIALVMGLIEAIPKIIEAAGSIVKVIWDVIRGKKPDIDGLGTELGDGFSSNFGGTASSAFNSGSAVGGNALSGLQSNSSSFGATGSAAGGDFANALGAKKGSALNNGGLVESNALTGISKNANQFNTIGGNAGANFSANLNAKTGNARSAGAAVASNAKNGISSNKSTFGAQGKANGSNFASGISSKKGDSTAAGGKISGAAAGKLNKTAEARSHGKDLGRGFSGGIGSMIDDVVSKAGEMAKSAVDTVKSWLHIGSPSKVLHQIGVWTGEGLYNGIDKMIQPVKHISRKLAEAATPDMGAIQTGLSMDMPNKIKTAMSSSMSATVQSGGLADTLGAKIEALGDRIDGMEVAIDGKTAGQIVAPHVSEAEAKAQRYQFKAKGLQY
ncbi:phage tail tape measure protein [Listeria aquatica]|uniref:phage tail tape measure protein n=1 Tax=Listeria aquatica TaxID=1494960 RepID=UPI003EFA2D10